MFCDATFSVVPTSCRIAPSLCSSSHMALDKRAQSRCCVVPPQSRCPIWRSCGDPREVPRFVLKRACSGSFFQVMSWEPRQIAPTWTEIWWKTEKERMDVATGRTWTSCEWSERAGHAREYRVFRLLGGVFSTKNVCKLAFSLGGSLFIQSTSCLSGGE